VSATTTDTPPHPGAFVPSRPSSVLICHHDEPLNRVGMARWLASWSDLQAVVVIREPASRMRARVRRELARVGPLRFFDVLAFRVYQRLVLARPDRDYEHRTLVALERRYAELPRSTRIIEVQSPNAAEVRALLEELRPTFMVARCKTILRREIYSAPRAGTFVMHPGICPEYRNAHGCFWALAARDMDRVGMTLLRVDAGVDTGAVYGYFTCAFDERRESHNVIQDRVVFDNLDAIRAVLERVIAGTARPIDTTGRESKAWGQPWMTSYAAWKRQARRVG
jgi:folate-dependent phosphoribosylglycinamide formyltransferase PurN